MKMGELRAMWLWSQLQHVKRKHPSTGRAVEPAKLTQAPALRPDGSISLPAIARKAAHPPVRLMSAPERGEGGEEVWGEGFIFETCI